MWQGFKRNITVLEENLNPISIPKINVISTNRKRLPGGSVGELSVVGAGERFVRPYFTRGAVKHRTSIVSSTLWVVERKAVHSGPPFPLTVMFTPV